MTNDRIGCRLDKLFEELFDIHFSENPQLRKESLFSDCFQLCARDLLLLLDKVQTEFCISLCADSIQSYGFLTYVDIHQNIVMALKGGER